MNFVAKAILAGRRTAVTILAVASLLAGFGVGDGFAQSAASLEIRALSSRPDLVSGGDALLQWRFTKRQV